MSESTDSSLFRSLGPSYLVGPANFGQALDQTGQLVLFNSSSVFKTILQAGSATADVTYTLPTGAPAGNNYLLGSSTAGALSWINAPGTYGPIGSAYVTIVTDATLTSERSLTGTSNQITVTDNGAGSTVVLSLPQSINTGAAPTFAGITLTAPAFQAAGSAAAPSYASSQNHATGLYFTSTGTEFDMAANGTRMIFAASNQMDFGSSTWTVELTSSGLYPATDNTIPCGASGVRWTAVWAANGTIQTSHSSTKNDITDIDPNSVEIPRAISFSRPGDPSIQLGFEADSLPQEAYAVLPDGTRSLTDIYLSAVVGVLCAKGKAFQARVQAAESILTDLQARANISESRLALLQTQIQTLQTRLDTAKL